MDVREAIARAVQCAVADATGTDGFGFCALYAVAGCDLANRILSGNYQLQAGSMSLLATEPDGWLNLRCGDLHRGEYHAWFARTDGDAELIDLSARHYPRWANSNREVLDREGKPLQWNWPGVAPEYLWMNGLHSPQVGLVAETAATEAFHTWACLQKKTLIPLIRRARAHFAGKQPD